MPPVDMLKRREPFRAYACGRHCSLLAGGRCCRALLVDMDRVGARLRFFDSASLDLVEKRPEVQMVIDNMADRRLAGQLRCTVRHRDGWMVVVHFSEPLKVGLMEMQLALAAAA